MTKEWVCYQKEVAAAADCNPRRPERPCMSERELLHAFGDNDMSPWTERCVEDLLTYMDAIDKYVSSLESTVTALSGELGTERLASEVHDMDIDRYRNSQREAEDRAFDAEARLQAIKLILR